MKSNNHFVSLKSLAKADHYRAQVQLKNKWIWAVLYGAIADTDPATASRLRDAFSERIEAATLSHAKTLIGAGGFGPKLIAWVNEHVTADANPFVLKRLHEAFPELKNETLLPRQPQCNLPWGF